MLISTLCVPPRLKKIGMFSKTRGRALWIEEFLEDNIYYQDHHFASINSSIERLGCLNCKSESHETVDCILPSRCVFKRGNDRNSRKMVLLRLRCNTVSNPSYMLPYDYPLKAIILNVNRKENCLYVRPQNLDKICITLENFLFENRHVMFCLAAPNKINIGEVYLIRRQGTNILARGVCAHMYFNWQMATQWQMYLIDIGQTEFIDQRSIYILPTQLHAIPPMAVPLVLTECRIGYQGAVSCNMDHFSMFNVGSTCLFVLSSSYQGQSLSLSKDGHYPNFANSLYPPPLLARIFCGTSLYDEIFCKWGVPEVTSLNHSVCPPYCPSLFAFSGFTLEYPLPVILTVEVTEKISQGLYWLRDVSLCSIISKQIELPSNGLWPYIEDGRSLACIAHVQRPLRKQPGYYRAIASNFDNQKSCCTIFLIDYGQTMYCDVHHLFDLSDQPPAILHIFAAAFKCIVNRRNADEYGIYAVKLAVDERYVIQITGKEDETTYVATVDMHIQADFQYPRSPDASNNISVDNSQFLISGYSNEINRSNEILDTNNIDNINITNNKNNSVKVKAMFPAAIHMPMFYNQKIENSLKALDRKFSVKLAQISDRVDELFSILRNLQLTNDASNLLPLLHAYQYDDVQEAPQNGTQSQTSSFPADGNDMIFCGTYSSLLRQEALSRCQAVTYSEQYIQQHQPNILASSRHCYFHDTENHRYNHRFRNHSPQSHHQPYIYTNHMNQQVKRHNINYIEQYHQQQRQQVRASGCAICSQQHNVENQTSRSYRFCGAYMDTKQHYFTSSYYLPNSTSRAKQPFTHIPSDRASTTSVNSSSTIHSSCKNSNTPSTAESQFSSRSSSPATNKYTNRELEENKKLYDKKTIEVKKKKAVIEDKLAKRCNKQIKQTEKFKIMNNFQDFESSKKNGAQSQLLPPPSEKSDESTRTTSSSVGPYHQHMDLFIYFSDAHDAIFQKDEREEMTNRKSNSMFIPTSTQKKKDAPTAYLNVNSKKGKDSNSVALDKTSKEARDQNIPESCWICGKVGHLTSYCQSIPPDIWLLAKEMKKAQQKKRIEKPRDEKGRVLYTSDESSDDELVYGSDSDESVKQVAENSSSLDYDIKLISDDDEKDELAVTLKYKAYFAHINMEFGHKYAVARSDDDISYSLWPLFFVQIQSDECQRILETHLDSLIANTPLSNTEMVMEVIGTLCIAYCERFDAKFRAVITTICSNVVEVFYIDYGNYEWVEHNMLWSIADQDKTTTLQPGMAIPCILNAYDQEKITSRLLWSDVVKMKLAVSCGRWGFYLRFQKQRPDGIYVVEVDEGVRMD
uniref:CCHC-type domain-containing protein n=1 Tax=Onchocerca volvulus TaxID=6282 RepID=A0A8R1TW67_ONCVO